MGVAQTGVTERTSGTAGDANSYFELSVAPGVSASASTTYLNCTTHGQGMIEPGEVTWTTGAAGQSGTGMTANLTISGGAITTVAITAQGQNVKNGDVLNVDPADIGGTGSGFVYTINSQQTGITTVTDISLAGEGYQIGDVLSVDDANVGGGGGSDSNTQLLMLVSQ